MKILRVKINKFRINFKIFKIHTFFLTGVYIVKNHPKFQNGTWSEDQVLRHFLDTFDTKGQEDGVVSQLILSFILILKQRN